jgi:preprotein translocase subunit SecG
MLYTVLLIAHVFIALLLIGVVLLQHGKGADAGAAFGSGASSTVFGSRGSANFLSRSTAVLATIFFLTSLALAYMARDVSGTPDSVVERAAQQAPAGEPAAQPVEQEATGDMPPPVQTESDSAGTSSADTTQESGEKTDAPPSETESR